MKLAHELVERGITVWTIAGCWRNNIPQDLAMRVQKVVKN